MLTGGASSLSYGVPPVPHLLARQVAAPGTWRHQPGSSGHLPCGANRSLRSVPRSAPVHAVCTQTSKEEIIPIQPRALPVKDPSQPPSHTITCQFVHLLMCRSLSHMAKSRDGCLLALQLHSITKWRSPLTILCSL